MYRHLPLKKRPVIFKDEFQHDDQSSSISFEFYGNNQQCVRAHNCFNNRKSKFHSSRNLTENDDTFSALYVAGLNESTIQKPYEPKAESLANIGDFNDNQNEQNEQKRQETDKQLLYCVYCEKAFNKKSSLNAHVKRHKSKEEGIHQCAVCNKTFSQSSNLVVHKRVHSGERPYRCSTCEATFKHSSSFNAHQLIHSGEKPYCCPQCGKAFIQSGNMNRHMNRKRCRQNQK